MRFLALLAIILVASTVSSRHRQSLLSRRLENTPRHDSTSPRSSSDVKTILGRIVSRVSRHFSMDVNATFQRIKELFQNPPTHTPFAVVLNSCNKTMTFKGCPKHTISEKTLGCLPFITQAVSANFISKKHGPITSNEIRLKSKESDWDFIIDEGMFYSYECDNHEMWEEGTYADWRLSMGLI